MNTETGKIITAEELAMMDAISQTKCVPITEQMMTARQKQTRQVSKYDGRSVLGRYRFRHEKRLRNKPCPCGSGVKFKKCCWNKVV